MVLFQNDHEDGVFLVVGRHEDEDGGAVRVEFTLRQPDIAHTTFVELLPYAQRLISGSVEHYFTNAPSYATEADCDYAPTGRCHCNIRDELYHRHQSMQEIFNDLLVRAAMEEPWEMAYLRKFSLASWLEAARGNRMWVRRVWRVQARREWWFIEQLNTGALFICPQATGRSQFATVHTDGLVTFDFPEPEILPQSVYFQCKSIGTQYAIGKLPTAGA